MSNSLYLELPLPEEYRPLVHESRGGTSAIADRRFPTEQPFLLKMSEYGVRTIARHIGKPFEFEARMVLEGRIQAMVHFPYGMADEDYVMLKLTFDARHTNMSFPWQKANVARYEG